MPVDSDRWTKSITPGEYPDALPFGRARGRGSAINPAIRFDRLRLHILGETLDEAAAEGRLERQVATFTLPDQTRSIINRVDSPDLPFHWTLNPYRGCEHGCTYCYARPTHELLGLSCGLDFETKIAVKHDAPALLERELAAKRWTGEPIVLSGVTDPYQPIEREHCITRACLSIMAHCRQPVGIVTKNRLVTRDLDHLAELARFNACCVNISLTTLDRELAAKMEPRASSPRDRLRAISDVAAAHVPVRVMIAPVIPGLTDHELPDLLAAAADAGAMHASWVMLRLPHQVKAVFGEWLLRHFPDRASRIESHLRSMRNGQLSDSSFGRRMRGEGPLAENIAQTFRIFAHRTKLDGSPPALSSASFRRPGPRDQPLLFD